MPRDMCPSKAMNYTGSMSIHSRSSKLLHILGLLCMFAGLFITLYSLKLYIELHFYKYAR